MRDPIHPARPQAPSPATRPGQIPPVPIVPIAPQAPSPEQGATREGLPHSPKRDGDNSGGESTASERGSADKGHQRAPRPGEAR